MKKALYILIGVFVILVIAGVIAYTNRSKSVIWDGVEYSSIEQVEQQVERIRGIEVAFEGKNDTYVLKATNFINISSQGIFNKMQEVLDEHLLESILHKEMSLDYDVYIDNDILLDYINNNITPNETTDAKDSTFTFDNKKVYIVNGHDGETVDSDKIISDFTQAVQNHDLNKTVSINYVVSPFKQVNIEEILGKVEKQPINAEISEDNGNTYLIKSVEGATLSEDEKATVEANKATPDFEFSVPLEKIQPERAEVDTSALFTSVLGEYSTSFATSASGRATNVSKATELLNGVILNPGDEFSYCDTVGRTTLDRGFAYATVYIGNEAVPGIGGGICQVSSTLYNAVLLADLEVTQRQNHSMPVGYVPRGRDATVSYGSIDFKFKNNYTFPIKIVTSSNNRVCSIKIMGMTSTKTVKLSVISNGSSGGYAKYSLYKTVTENGVVIKDDVLESRSSYKI